MSKLDAEIILKMDKEERRRKSKERSGLTELEQWKKDIKRAKKIERKEEKRKLKMIEERKKEEVDEEERKSASGDDEAGLVSEMDRKLT